MGSTTPVGGDAAQVVQQHIGVVIDGRDAVRGEEFWEQAHHHLAVLEHVRDTGRDAQVVFEHAELAGLVAHDVDAGDVGVDAAGDVDPLHLRAVLGVTKHLFRGDDARLEDLLVVVNVVEKGVQRAHALLQAALELDPFIQGQDAGNDVEGDESFGTLFLAVNRKSDAHAMEQGVGFGAFLTESVGGLVLEPLVVAEVVRTGRAIGQDHFVIRFIAQKVPFSRTVYVCDSALASLPIMYRPSMRRNGAPTRGARRRRCFIMPRGGRPGLVLTLSVDGRGSAAQSRPAVSVRSGVRRHLGRRGGRDAG